MKSSRTIILFILFTVFCIDVTAQRPVIPTLDVPEHQIPQSFNSFPSQQLQTNRNINVNPQPNTYSHVPPKYNRGIPLPYFGNMPGANLFEDAFKEIDSMLRGEKTIDLKRAVFISENAYFGGKLNYREFNAQIKNVKDLCLTKIRQKRLDPNDDMVKKMIIYEYITDTFIVKKENSEQRIIHYPVKYDFESLLKNNKTCEQFCVSNLLTKNKGQCYSIPLFYLIMAKELGTEAYWAMAPMHTFIKFKDNRGKWLCMELTSRGIVNDNFYLENGFVKPEALKNRIYLEPLNDTQTLSVLLKHLAILYEEKYGYDIFVKKCVQTALNYDANNLGALMVLSNYHTYISNYTLRRLNYPSEEKVKRYYPEVDNMVQTTLGIYRRIDELGFEEVSKEKYADWIRNAEKEMRKPEYQQKMQLQQVIK